jgi:class 3 adenylate cyclase
MGRDRELVILFADVVGSTRLFEVLGDVRARDMVTTCVELMKRASEQHRGRVIKTMGDEVMATFETSDDSLDAAAQMQTEITAHPDLQVEGQHVAIRVGAHYGPVVEEERDVFGAAVHTANRMTSQAKAGQIIVTDGLMKHASAEWHEVARMLDVSVPRGQQGEVGVYEVLWQRGEATSMLPSIATLTEHHRPFHIRLRYGDREITLDDRQRPSATIGRGEDNDLVVRGNLVSRLHARIEAGKNRFMLVDQSTNGSFVQTSKGEDAFVRRDSVPLSGNGIIGLGRVPEAESYHTIEYFCDE